MNSSLLNLLGNLLLTTVASVSPQTPVEAPTLFAGSHPAVEVTANEGAERRRARAARISLADPYYSFSRAKRAHKD